MEEKIKNAVKEVLEKLGAKDTIFVVERPNNLAFGDYTTNAALLAAKTLGRNSRELADSLALELRKILNDKVSKIETAGSGFVNISLNRETISLFIDEANAKGDEWGRNNSEEGRRVLIEYTNPNPFKEMHIGHLMSNIIGEAESRLIENAGATVIRANFQGDVGPHVAKAIWGLQKNKISIPTSAKEIGEAYVMGAKEYDDSPYVKEEIDLINQKIYDGKDFVLMELWRKGRDVSLSALERIYKILGTRFDYYFFESETAESGLRIIKDGLSKGIFEESEGAIIYRGEKRGLHTLVFVTSRGTPTYETKDMGLAFLKEERIKNDRSIIITAAEQQGHFKVVLAALAELAPLVAKKTEHVSHGFLRLTSGKMSSREGNVITADELIQNVMLKASEKNKDPLIAEQVAVGAIKYMILRQAPGMDIIFDEEKSLSLEGDSGPYLQYALVRARSVLEKARNIKHETLNKVPKTLYQLERLIVHFPEVVARSARELSPNLLVTYLTELAGEWNAFYAKERIIGGDNELHKLRITQAFISTMTKGLTLLGIPIPEKM